MLKLDENRNLVEDEHEREEENAGIHVVVEGQRPDIILKQLNKWNIKACLA